MEDLAASTDTQSSSPTKDIIIKYRRSECVVSSDLYLIDVVATAICGRYWKISLGFAPGPALTTALRAENYPNHRRPALSIKALKINLP